MRQSKEEKVEKNGDCFDKLFREANNYENIVL